MNADNFVWTDEEVAQQGVDWESCQSKYIDIWTECLQQYPVPGGTSYPRNKDAICKSQISSKLKAIWTKYRWSGRGRVITLDLDLCNNIWGGSPATTTIEAARLFAFLHFRRERDGGVFLRFPLFKPQKRRRRLNERHI